MAISRDLNSIFESGKLAHVVRRKDSLMTELNSQVKQVFFKMFEDMKTVFFVICDLLLIIILYCCDVTITMLLHDLCFSVSSIFARNMVLTVIDIMLSTCERVYPSN